jgi:putative DNA primase/helicase
VSDNLNTNNYLSEYILPDENDSLDLFIHQTPYFKWCLINAEALDHQMILMLAGIIAKLDSEAASYEALLLEGMSYEQAALYKRERAQAIGKDVPYTVLAAFGYEIDFTENGLDSPIQFAKREQQKYRLQVRGLYENNKKSVQLEANTFAEYLLTRLPLVQNEEGEYFRFNGSCYERIGENVLKKLCRDILNEAGQTIWKKRFEADYMAAFAHVVPFVKEFDTEPDILNMKNGLLNIKTLEFSEHTKEHLSIKQLPYEYNAEAACPKFEDFLQDIFEGDQERVMLIKQILGYCWLQEVKIHKAFLFIGTGSNGKSALAKVMRNLYGHFNVSGTSLGSLEDKFGKQDLPGKLVNISSENEFSKEFSTENFKTVTSGDATIVERKHRDSFTTALYTKLVILLNRMMDSNDTSDGFTRRLLIIPFNKRFIERRQDEPIVEGVPYVNPDLEKELLEELPGILNFSLEGLHNLMENDFRLVTSTVCEEALDNYKRHQNPVISFMDECVEYCHDERILRSSVTEQFQAWYQEHGTGTYRKLSKPKILGIFKEEIRRRGWQVDEVKIHGHMYLKQIRFKTNLEMGSDHVSPTF